MARPNSLAALGPIEQLAYVPTDFDAAVKYWTETMGVGPFFLIENIHLDGMTYRGQPTDARFAVAIAYWGDIQIELVRAENDAPAHYNGEYANHDKLNHVLVFVDDWAATMRAVEAAGAEVIVGGTFGGNNVVYVDPGSGPGGLIEILQRGQGGPDLFGMIKAAARDWDGSEPLRKLG
jgi:catechol 2,3-dioxygenase-like lactoylglutathione lyase family enzyme